MAKRKRQIIVKKPEFVGQVNLLDEIEAQKYTEEQAKFIKYEGKESIILRATAGSGKSFCAVERLKELIKRGVDPSKIIFFSFTKAAVQELEKRVGTGIKITTIHSFCQSVLLKSGKYKKIATFYDFVNWYKEVYKPTGYSDQQEKDDFWANVNKLYEEADYISSTITAYKLQKADGIEIKRVPEFIKEYREFLYETRSRDFTDMLIEVRNMFLEDKWLRMFRGQYDFIFVDEVQDTSVCQMNILLALNAPTYYLFGDRAQSIFAFSGTNCIAVEEALKKRRNTIEMTLSKNFRSDRLIVENSNKYSDLKAISHSQKEGYIDYNMMLSIDELEEVLKQPEEVVVLVRTNDVIKRLEQAFLKRKLPLRYFNFITETDVKNFDKGEINDVLSKKLTKVHGYFGGDNQAVIDFIKKHQNSKNFLTSIHRSKGREFDVCVVINSIPPEVLYKNENVKNLTKKQLSKITFTPNDEDDFESKNIHYVSITRSRHKLYFMAFII
jgi:DNA helicase-2/ATP-dependent DNA helicase PcrA